MSHTLVLKLRLDFELLRQQKALVIKLRDQSAPSTEAYLLDGIVHVFDSIQDQAADEHAIPVKEVFGPDYGEPDDQATTTGNVDGAAARPSGRNRKRPKKPKS